HLTRTHQERLENSFLLDRQDKLGEIANLDSRLQRIGLELVDGDHAPDRRATASLSKQLYIMRIVTELEILRQTSLRHVALPPRTSWRTRRRPSSWARM